MLLSLSLSSRIFLFLPFISCVSNFPEAETGLLSSLLEPEHHQLGVAHVTNSINVRGAIADAQQGAVRKVVSFV
jgi:hypothetical protein